MKATRKVGKLLGILPVQEDTNLMIISEAGKIIRLEAGDVRKVGRSTSGVKLVNLNEGDSVAAACVVKETVYGKDEDEEPFLPNIEQ